VFHWNVTGHQFQSLHIMFEQQYTELALAVDLIAERIRALDVFSPGSYSQFEKLATVREETGVPAAADMIRQLASDHETIVKTIRDVLPTAEEAEDEATLGLLTERLTLHEKTAWMLRSFSAREVIHGPARPTPKKSSAKK
jgi:starvation-inducible DNA-binding protein